MKKTFFIVLAICFMLLAIVASYFSYYKKVLSENSITDNETYEQYASENIIGTDLISLINKAVDQNQKNSVDKDKNGLFKDNKINSIRIDVKFAELDEPVSMEKIYDKGQEQFIKFYNISKFNCTKKEYHNGTKNIKYMYFEEVVDQ